MESKKDACVGETWSGTDEEVRKAFFGNLGLSYKNTCNSAGKDCIAPPNAADIDALIQEDMKGIRTGVFDLLMEKQRRHDRSIMIRSLVVGFALGVVLAVIAIGIYETFGGLWLWK